jgi:hypothetical protein
MCGRSKFEQSNSFSSLHTGHPQTTEADDARAQQRRSVKRIQRPGIPQNKQQNRNRKQYSD